MIFKRRLARQRRAKLYATLQSIRDDVRREVEFEENLGIVADQPFERAFGNSEEWGMSRFYFCFSR